MSVCFVNTQGEIQCCYSVMWRCQEMAVTEVVIYFIMILSVMLYMHTALLLFPLGKRSVVNNILM